MMANPEVTNRWRVLPTPEEWKEITRFARELLALDEPTKRKRLEHLSLGKPRLAQRLAQIVGMSLAPL
jgi:hypothetical protein